MSSVARLRQRLSHWTATNPTNRFGERSDASWSSPTELSCRWEEGTRRLRQTNRDDVTFDLRIFVNEELPIGSLVKKAKIEELQDGPQTDLFEVVEKTDTPNIKGRRNVRTYLCNRYSGALNYSAQ